MQWADLDHDSQQISVRRSWTGGKVGKPKRAASKTPVSLVPLLAGFIREWQQQTPYGEPSGPFIYGLYCDKEVVFLARHGIAHAIPPHRVNYRANLWALKNLGVTRIISIAAVGGITAELSPGRIAFPDQIIDYTWSRDHTFFEEDLDQVIHH